MDVNTVFDRWVKCWSNCAQTGRFPSEAAKAEFRRDLEALKKTETTKVPESATAPLTFGIPAE